MPASSAVRNLWDFFLKNALLFLYPCDSVNPVHSSQKAEYPRKDATARHAAACRTPAILIKVRL
jgi:hypothetical protein